jgi:hypothetical protein
VLRPPAQGDAHGQIPHTLSTPLRISRELDIVGDLTATLDTPSALLAWAHALPEPVLCAWRAEDSGTRYIHVSALCRRAPLRGQVTAERGADHHRPFWSALLAGGDLAPGDEQLLPLSALLTACSTTTPPPGVNTTRITPTTLLPPATDRRDAS